METSESIAALADALSKAQAEVEGATKGKVNPAFKSKYADLASVWDACRDALTSNGLAVIQSPGEIVEGRMQMTTMLVHKSGEWVRDRLTIPLAKVDAQAYGSATTYARRYALAAFVGVAPDDDDGNAATAAAKSNGNGKSAYQAKKDGLGPRCDELKHEIAGLESVGALQAWAQERHAEISTLPQNWQDLLREEWSEQRRRIMEAAGEIEDFHPAGD